MNFNCPVCNKGGLRDFKVTQTVCPQCNSDLRPFLLLGNISSSPKKAYPLLILIGVTSIALAFAFMYFNIYFEKKKTLSSNSGIITQFQDSINKLRSSLGQMQTGPIENKEPAKEVAILYIVRKNDCASKIADLFYNDPGMYKKIEADNSLKHPYILQIGQVLSIKIK